MGDGMRGFNPSSPFPSHVAVLHRTRIKMKRAPNVCGSACWPARVQCTLASFSLEGKQVRQEQTVPSVNCVKGTLRNIFCGTFRGDI